MIPDLNIRENMKGQELCRESFCPFWLGRNQEESARAITRADLERLAALGLTADGGLREHPLGYRKYAGNGRGCFLFMKSLKTY